MIELLSKADAQTNQLLPIILSKKGAELQG